MPIADMILYLENPKHSTRKLLDLIHEFSKVSEYKIDVQKSIAFLYINNNLAEDQLKKGILFIIATNKEERQPRSIVNQGGERSL